MIDPQTPLFSVDLFTQSLDFIDHHLRQGQVLVHCNLGHSRAPSIALVYLAKRLRQIPATSYQEAEAEFRSRYQDYLPGDGIRTFLTREWNSIL